MVSLLDWASSYLDFCKQKFIRNTYQEKVHAFRLLFRSVSFHLPVSKLTKADILSHFLRLSRSGRSGNAVNNDRKNLVAGWNWGIKYLTGFPVENPFLVEQLPEIRSPRYIPPLSDFWKVLDFVECSQDRILLLCYLYLAARRSEVFRLQVSDVDFFRGQVRLSTRKRENGSLEYDLLPLADPLYPILQDHILTLSGPWVFPNLRTGLPYAERGKWMRRLCGLARVQPIGLHAIRHLLASILADKGVPLVQIQYILRHKRLSTTDKYIRSLGSCRNAVAALPAPPAR